LDETRASGRRRCEDDVIRDRVANKNGDFWHEVKKIRASNFSSNYLTDGQNSASDLAQLFRANNLDL
jgi:hypothetical protein